MKSSLNVDCPLPSVELLSSAAGNAKIRKHPTNLSEFQLRSVDNQVPINRDPAAWTM